MSSDVPAVPDVATTPHPAPDPAADPALVLPTPKPPAPDQTVDEQPDPAVGLIDPRQTQPGPEPPDPSLADDDESALQVTELPELGG
jgi:hypothetical protein